MKFIICIAMLFSSIPFLFCQSELNSNESFYVIPEFVLGKTLEANDGFPKTQLQKGLFVNLGQYNFNENNIWARQLNYPKTGVSIGIIDFGETEKIGRAYTFIPFIEYQLFKRWNLHVGMGGSYMDTLYDEENNPSNRAITTHLNWSFRSFMHYRLLNNKVNWRFGLGYIHHSNGHTRLPNQGLNSLLASFSAVIDTQPEAIKSFEKTKKKKSVQTYFSGRFGYGENVLSEIFNEKKPVYTMAFSAGRIYNKTFKFGGGFYYRFYQHYYDYIKNEEDLVIQEYPIFLENPTGYASNYGLFATAELLLGHVGFEFSLGFNIHKPFYPIDWKLNEGFDYVNPMGETIDVLGELDWYYEIKRSISSRLGLNFYLINTNKSPKHNVALGLHINGNLGQADFTDLSLIYVYHLDLINKK
ncbi:MAG: acyloxyacyl hydrolase [Bacteroidia bacterium]|nr:acyloxyacyl hydrolase [Bacteroidia bacterium]NND24821.1 deacylase [Flavobacteriaceae bacterium]NNK60417.1 deacylase [Flavobacteriaceae bacterium]